MVVVVEHRCLIKKSVQIESGGVHGGYSKGENILNNNNNKHVTLYRAGGERELI